MLALRAAGLQDLATVRGWMADSDTRHHLFATHRHIAADDAARLWTAAGGLLWVATVPPGTDHAVAGLRLEAGEVSFLVDPARQGQGLGRALLTAWLAGWRADGAVAAQASTGPPALQARTRRENLRCRRLLADAGFAETGLQAQPGGLAPLVVFRLPG